MNLQEMLKEVHRYDENVIIAEFRNGVGIAYKKMQDEVIYAAIPPNNGRNITLEYVNKIERPSKDRDLLFLSLGKFDYFARKFKEKSYETKLERKIEDQFAKVAEELEITTYTKRYWKGIGIGLLFAPLLPVTIPAALIIPQIGYLVGAPLGAISEVIKPSTRYAYVGKENAVVAENNDLLPAVYFRNDSGWGSLPSTKFNYMQVCFHSGDKGNVFQGDLGKPGFKLSGLHIRSSEFLREEIKNEYQSATQFLNISPEVNDKMNKLLEERAAFPKVWKEFTSQLNKENQEALLKSIGFI